MREYAGDVEPVRARHAVLASVARHHREIGENFRNVFEEFVFLFVERFERCVGAYVVLQVFHVGHAAQHGEYARL